MLIIAIGAVLVLVGLGGAAASCLSAEPLNVAQVLASAVAFAVGILLVAIGGGRHGYHRRPLGAPPGDADPDKVSDPAPDKL